MGLTIDRAGRAALRRYRAASPATRAHVALRWLSCPFGAVEAALPRAGRILEVGCGHGLASLYAAIAEPSRSLEGVDIDDAKVAEGAKAAAGLDRVTLRAVAPGWLPPPAGAYDAVLVVDVLYLLGPGPGEELLDACAAALAPGGTLVVKEIDTSPAWKYRLALAQERAATRTGLTEGATVRFLDPPAIVARLAAADLQVEQRRVDRGYPHPHLLLVGRRPVST